MAINPKIKQKAEDIRKKIFGSEVRESLASGIEAISEDVEATIGRQDYVEEQFQNVIDETTDKDVISAPELIAARNGKSNLKTRLDEEHAEVTAQLQQRAEKATFEQFKFSAEQQLADIKVKGVYSINEFFDETKTDAEIFKNAVETLSTAGGGELRLEQKTYVFNDLIDFITSIRDVDIVGVTNGTIIQLKSPGYGVIFTANVHRIKFKNIRFELSDLNKGVYFPKTPTFSYHVYFDNCNFYGGINNVTIEHGAYIHFRDSTFTTNAGVQDEARITIGSKIDLTSYNEYIYLTNCNIDGGQGRGIGNGINVFQAEYLIIDKCDIPNWYGVVDGATRKGGIGINIESYGRMWDIYIHNVSIPRCYVGIFAFAKKSTIQKIVIENLFDFVSSESWFADSVLVKTQREGSYSVEWLVIERLNTLPNVSYQRTYVLDLNNVNYGYCENIGNNIPIRTETVNFFRVTQVRDELRKSPRKYITDASPTLEVDSVSTVVSCSFSVAHTLTQITGGTNGYEVTFIPVNANLTIAHNASIILKDKVAKTLETKETLTLKLLDSVWYQV